MLFLRKKIEEPTPPTWWPTDLTLARPYFRYLYKLHQQPWRTMRPWQRAYNGMLALFGLMAASFEMVWTSSKFMAFVYFGMQYINAGRPSPLSMRFVAHFPLAFWLLGWTFVVTTLAPLTLYFLSARLKREVIEQSKRETFDAKVAKLKSELSL